VSPTDVEIVSGMFAAAAQDRMEAGDRVVAFVHERRRGRGSGVDVGADIAFIYTFNGSKISRIEPYMDQSEARAAAGLPLQAER
jgi:ketosteroid isomerase-like protein